MRLCKFSNKYWLSRARIIPDENIKIPKMPDKQYQIIFDKYTKQTNEYKSPIIKIENVRTRVTNSSQIPANSIYVPTSIQQKLSCNLPEYKEYLIEKPSTDILNKIYHYEK